MSFFSSSVCSEKNERKTDTSIRITSRSTFLRNSLPTRAVKPRHPMFCDFPRVQYTRQAGIAFGPPRWMAGGDWREAGYRYLQPHLKRYVSRSTGTQVHDLKAPRTRNSPENLIVAASFFPAFRRPGSCSLNTSFPRCSHLRSIASFLLSLSLSHLLSFPLLTLHPSISLDLSRPL
jgi:hypothetical protein